MENKIIFDLKIKDNELLEQLTENARQSRVLRDNIKELSKDYEKNAAEIEQNKIELKLLGQEQTRMSNLVVKSYNIQAGSIQANRIELSKLKEEYIKLGKPTEEQRKKILDLTNTLKDQEAAIGDFRRNVGNYREAFAGFGSDLAQGLSSGSSSVGDVVGGGLGAIAGLHPALALIGPVVANITDNVTEATTAFIQMRGEAQALTGETGEGLDDLVSKLKSTADVFDSEYNDVLRASNTLAKEFNITQAEAAELIQKGFLSGANINGEFLDTVREYSTQFRAAGIEAEGFISVISQNVKDGIFSDKGADVIKEAGLRIREQTKATVDALKPLGEETNKQIIEAINEDRVFDAIKLVSKGLTDVTLTASETQTIIADVFGGPGEDAGLAYLQNLQNINLELDSQIDSTNELTRQQQLNLRTQERYNDELAEFASLFEGTGSALSRIGTDLAASFFSVVNGIVKGFKIVGEAAGGIKDLIVGAFTFDTELYTKGLADIAGATDRVNKEIAVKKAESEKKSAEEQARLTQERLKKQAEIDKKNADAEAEKKSKADKERAEKLARQQEEIRQKDIARRKAQLELELLQTEEGTEAQLKKREEIILFAANAEKANKQKSEEEKLLIEAKAIKDVEKLRKDYLEARKTETLAILELAKQQAEELLNFEKSVSDTDRQIRTQQINEQFDRQNLEISQQVLLDQTSLEDSYRMREAAELAHMQRMLELAKEKGDYTVQLEQQIADKIQSIRQADMEREKQIQDAKFAVVSNSLNSLSELTSLVAGQSTEAAEFQKAITLFQIATDTAAAISSLIKMSQANPANAVTAGVAGVAQFTAGLAQIITNVNKARELLTKPVPQPSFYEGGIYGYTGDGNPREESTQLGKKKYTYHKRELIVPDRVLRTPRGRYLGEQMMMLIKNTSPRYRDLSGFANGGVYVDGGYSVRQTTAQVSSQQQSNQMQKESLIEAVKKLPVPKVIVEDIRKGLSNQQKIRVDSSL